MDKRPDTDPLEILSFKQHIGEEASRIQIPALEANRVDMKNI